MTVAPEITEPTGERPQSTRRPSGFAALLLRLHFYAGVLVAPFLVVAAVTGLLYTATPQLDAMAYGDKLTVAERTDTPLSLAEQIANAQAAHPDGTVSAIQPGSGDATTKVVFSLPELGEKQHTVYVNPYTGAVQGQLTTSWGSTPLTTWLGDLHRNLHLGVAGRYYSEFAASWLWLLVLGGIVLWWRRRRSVRKMLAPELSAKKGVRRTRGWHAATGVWLTVGLLILSVTGLTWSRYAGGNFDAALISLSAHKPELSTSITTAPSGGGHHSPDGSQSGGPVGGPVGVAADAVLKVARNNGLYGPVELTVPKKTGDAWTVSGIDNTWPVNVDRLAVNQTTTSVVARSAFADWPLLAQLSKLGVQAHMGRLFGLANQLLLAALALGLLCVIFWGYRMWWQRRPTRVDRRALVGAAPARGGWRGLPTWTIMVGVPVLSLLGWAIPLFGIPLVAFLVIDAVVAGWRRGSRPQIPVSPAPAGR